MTPSTKYCDHSTEKVNVHYTRGPPSPNLEALKMQRPARLSVEKGFIEEMRNSYHDNRSRL